MAHTFPTTPAVKPPAPQPVLPLKQDVQNFISVVDQRVNEVTKRLIDEKQPVMAKDVLESGLGLLAKLRAVLAGIR